jgi:hypothetical protein
VLLLSSAADQRIGERIARFLESSPLDVLRRLRQRVIPDRYANVQIPALLAGVIRLVMHDGADRPVRRVVSELVFQH